MQQRRKKTPNLNYGSLEHRKVLAANPIVSFADATITIEGTSLDDEVRIAEQDDTIKVAVRADGESFDFYEFSDAARLEFSGGNGDDLFVNRSSIYTVAYGNDGNDWLLGGSGVDVLRGGSGDDNLRGFEGDDSLHGDYGNDRLYGYEGNDRLLGWYGNDILVGGDGDDYVSGYLGNDILFAGAGDDVLKGHEGNDFLVGGDGNDELYGWKGVDRLYGGSGDDYLSGYHGNDLLAGQDGDDVIKGHEGRDRMFGGQGNDLMYGWKGVDTMNGGEGNDELWGGDDGDLLVGWTGNDILHGDMGDDFVYGGEGDDVVVGYYGNDRIVGGTGADMLCGGYGKDTYVQVEDHDVGYDPDGDFASTPGVDDDNVLQKETWEQFDSAMEDFQTAADKIAKSMTPEVDLDFDGFENDTASTKLYINDSAGRLSSYDTASGEYQYIGSMGVRLTDIAMSAEGELYGISFSSLYRVDVDSAQAVEVGRLGRGDMNALTFDGSGRLLAAGFGGQHVYNVNVENGQMTSLGQFNGKSAGDLSFHNDQLYVTTTQGKLFSMTFDSSGEIADKTYVAKISSVTYGLASLDGNFYGVVGTELYDVSEQGVFTSVTNLGSSTVSQIWGMTEGVS